MPAQSQQQQKLFGLALAFKRGEVPSSEVSDEIKAIADRMSEKEIEDYAKTKHKGLPKMKEQLRKIVREIMREQAISEMNEVSINEDENPCWDGYEMVGMKMKDGKEVPNCVPKNESVNEGKFQKDDLVYNTRTKTVGIVRIGDDKYGEVKTDADGNVDVDELEKYNPIKFKHQTKAKVAPSTEKEVNKRGLFNPFKNESVNEVDTKKADMIRKSMPGFVGPKFAKKASDEDILAMVDLKDQHAKIYNRYMKDINDKISKLQKKYRIKESVNEGASTEEKRIVMMAIKKIAKYRNVPLNYAVGDVIRAAEELERTIKK